jgi:hypothetical protein
MADKAVMVRISKIQFAEAGRIDLGQEPDRTDRAPI